MGKTITTRLPDEFIEDLDKVSEIEHLDTSAVVRRLLALAIREWKRDYAAKKYAGGEFSFGQVAEFADVSIWDVPILLKEKKVPILDEEDLEVELKSIKWQKKKK